MSFNLSEVIHIISTIDDLLSMGEHPYTITTSAGYDVEDDEEIEFINFIFPLKNGIVSMKMYDSVGLMTYKNHSGEILKNIEFDDMSVAELNGSFKKVFKQVREFDRQQASTAKSNNTSIDRASFGLAEVN
ncbi:hypothetical protein [Chamaesiphon minutus]|uniref:DUF1828 domain-containing protein n=1 Tax=Chamaesiphon minutus (strain ATCC 27169 / PCC 6605) TaxID=1173020 RepID=K9UGR8_CHAP6|nr:hypothetical protein [Chamaesiphon minutus]AFY94287.1 hypothetical protein Cha6605_3280 [Chamaesiphon minutus PCC 6605]